MSTGLSEEDERRISAVFLSLGAAFDRMADAAKQATTAITLMHYELIDADHDSADAGRAAEIAEATACRARKP